ncbi:MAG: DUF2975 domain-containing protein [Clostridiales bacterium]|nr:DUF2975 domain-containing protein [Clostridiales bacterium]
MRKNSFVHYLTKVLIDILFYGGILCCIAAPFVMPYVLTGLGYPKTRQIEYAVIILSSGVCALCIVWQLKMMLKTLLGGNPFVPKNVTCLRRCSIASFLIAIIFTGKLFLLLFTPSSLIIVMIFFLLGLFCLTLKDVFKEAIAYKEEQDWTV